MRALPASLRLLNQRRLLEFVLRAGGASRATLADATGMSRPTAGRIIDDLIAAGVVEERGDVPEIRRRGRPGRHVVPEGRTPRFLLIEVGVRRTRLAAVPLAVGNEDLWDVSFATPQSEKGFLLRFAKARAGLALRRPWAFALSLPGVIDERSGLSHYDPHLRWTEGGTLVTSIERVLRIPGCVIQEIRALALGHIACTPDERDFLLVDSDDGLAAAAMLRGQLFQGTLPMTNELGHTRVAGNPLRCGCGNVGCLETLAARPGLLAAYARAAHRPGAEWADLLRALARDPLPRWLAHSLDACTDVISGALNVLGLNRVVLTGAFNDLPDAAITYLGKGVARGSLATRFGDVQVRVAPRRRARGLLAALVDRRLIPTEDWEAPCAPNGDG